MKHANGVAWFVYILRCADRTFYTGITKDLTRRCRQHNNGTASRYTRSRRPTRLVYQEAQPDQGAALRREAAIKSLSRRQKELLIGRQRRQAS
jgi:predicted GIY-YIG superfamily endonuclease